MEQWIEIGRLDAIPRRGARCIGTPRGKIAIFRTHNDEIYALEDHCPNKAGPLSQGIVHGRAVTCPIHNIVFSLENGKALGADEGAVKTYPIENRNGFILIARPALIKEPF